MKKLALGIFVLHALALASAAVLDEIQTNRYFTPKDLTTPFTITLDLDAAFDISVLSIDGPAGQSAFCQAYPSEIKATVAYSGTIPAGTSYDNVLYFDGRYYALDTNSWRVLSATDMSDPKTYRYIEVDSSLIHQHSTEIPVLVIDEAHKYLYILRTDMAASYSLISFTTAVKNNATVPKISHQVTPWETYTSVKSAKYYNQNFHFIVDGNRLEVWTPSSSGDLIYNTAITHLDTLGSEVVDITGIAFKDNYAFVLDELNSVIVLNVTNYLSYSHLSTNDIPISDAKFIEIAGNSLNIISMNRRSTILHEYTISTSPSLSITSNRQIELRDAIRDTFSDTNFVYSTTGFQNLVAKHSIPSTYNSDVLKNGYTSSWNLTNIGGIASHAEGSTSKVVVIQKTQVTVYNFFEAKATLKCRAGNYKQGTYVYNIQSMQRTCKAKTTSTTNDVCRVKQAVAITIDGSAPQVSTPESNSNTGLIVGIIIALLTVGAIGFAYWYFKLRNKAPSPTVRNDVFFRRLSRSPLNQDSSNLYKVTMDIDRSGARPDGKTDDIIIDDKLGDMRKKSDDFVLGPQRSDDAEESPKRAVIVRGKTFSELEKPRKPIGAPKTNTMSNIEGGHYEGEV